MTVDDFFETINATLASPKFSDCPYPVYRGHAKDSYALLPTLLRDYNKTGKDIWTLENNLYCDFRSLVGPRVRFDNSWQSLFAMRHEGIPTRLLDWTENIGTALFFAFDAADLDSPHIWILNPFALNKKNRKIGETLLNPEEDLPDYQSTFASKCNDNSIPIYALPFAVYPNRSNDRIYAQRGLFTVHGEKAEKMEDLCPDCLEKITIPDELIDKLKKILLQFGINKYSVYPDFKGLADYLKQYYRY